MKHVSHYTCVLFGSFCYSPWLILINPQLHQDMACRTFVPGNKIRPAQINACLLGFMLALLLTFSPLLYFALFPVDNVFYSSNRRLPVFQNAAGKRNPRILCWISTKPDNHRLKAQHVKATWARRCDKFIFFSTANDPSLPTVKLANITAPESRALLWPKAMAALRYCYDNYRHDYDWFLKADDDTYVIVENLRRLLLNFDSNSPWYFARRIKFNSSTKPMLSGGAGYVLSREALRKLVEDGFNAKTNSVNCNRQAIKPVTDDVELNECLEALHIPEANSRDAQNRGRFWNFPLEPRINLLNDSSQPHFHYWLHETDTEQIQPQNISPHSISFHHVKPSHMYLYEFLLYHMDSRYMRG